MTEGKNIQKKHLQGKGNMYQKGNTHGKFEGKISTKKLCQRKFNAKEDREAGKYMQQGLGEGEMHDKTVTKGKYEQRNGLNEGEGVQKSRIKRKNVRENAFVKGKYIQEGLCGEM